MKLEKWKQALIMGISFGILLLLPFLGEIYYKTLYYIGTILLIPIVISKIIWNEKFEKKFYMRWHKAREQGFKVNVARESVKGFVFMIVVVIIDQLFGRGFTPIDIAHKLPNVLIFWLILFLIAFGLVLGIIAWHENEKRYCRIYFAMKEETHGEKANDLNI